MRTLVVGCDASGKSTLLNGIQSRFGDVLIESTSTDESRTFKRSNLDRLVDEAFIDDREAMYLRLSRGVLTRTLADGIESYVGTDSILVTRLSHNVMRRCIGGVEIDTDSIIESWLEDESIIGANPPDAITLTHAPFKLIRERIVGRQQGGDSDEKFWGFNSPYFLNEYQEAWKSMIPSLSKAGFMCLAFDTSDTSTEVMLEQYEAARESLNSFATN